MEKITSVKVSIITVIGAIGSFIANLFGGWTSDLVTLIIMMGIDFTMVLLIAEV